MSAEMVPKLTAEVWLDHGGKLVVVLDEEDVAALPPLLEEGFPDYPSIETTLDRAVERLIEDHWGCDSGNGRIDGELLRWADAFERAAALLKDAEAGRLRSFPPKRKP